MTRHDGPPPLGFSAAREALPFDPQVLRRLADGYRPWRRLRYAARDLGVDPVAAWRLIKGWRLATRVELPLRRLGGGNLSITQPPELLGPLFRIDRAGGDDLLRSTTTGVASSPLVKRLRGLFAIGQAIPSRLSAESLMGEAAESSIMEGASATRAQALDMLRHGTPPRSVGDRMILNNYTAMQFVKRSLGTPLSMEFIVELQRLLTERTLDREDAVGRLRHDHDAVRVVDTRDNSTVFTPPPARAVPALLHELFEFANNDHLQVGFLHPIVKSCILHFMIGYIHPFVDGNGRTARAIFYWHALRHGYGIFEYIPISEVIRAGFARYSDAYLDSQLDDGDLTYFVLYHLDVVEQSLDRLAEHLKREEVRIKRADSLLSISSSLNLRQRLILEHAWQHPQTRFTVKSHANSNGITPVTARSDLDELVRRKLLTTTKRGKEVLYHPSPTLLARLRRKGV
jgi:Fic family protein